MKLQSILAATRIILETNPLLINTYGYYTLVKQHKKKRKLHCYECIRMIVKCNSRVTMAAVYTYMNMFGHTSQRAETVVFKHE